jgi:hypothetical protein
MARADTLWGDWNELQKYDMAVFSCECGEAVENKGPSAYEAVTRYLQSGGRVFGTDYQYVWYKYTTDAALRDAVGIQGMAPEGVNPVILDTSFPKGQALADWLAYVRPTSPYGEVSCSFVFDNFTSASEPATQIWGASTQAATGEVHPRFITMNVPVGVSVEEQCGRAVHLDAHITSIFTRPVTEFPADCGTDFENGEQVLAFFFFDVAACIQDDNEQREPPVIIR